MIDPLSSPLLGVRTTESVHGPLASGTPLGVMLDAEFPSCSMYREGGQSRDTGLLRQTFIYS